MYDKKGVVPVEIENGLIQATVEKKTHLNGPRVTLSIRPEAMHIKPRAVRQEGDSFTGQVEHVAFQGNNIEYQVQIGNSTVTVRGAQGSRLPVGVPDTLMVSPEHCLVLPD